MAQVQLWCQPNPPNLSNLRKVPRIIYYSIYIRGGATGNYGQLDTLRHSLAQQLACFMADTLEGVAGCPLQLSIFEMSLRVPPPYNGRILVGCYFTE